MNKAEVATINTVRMKYNKPILAIFEMNAIELYNKSLKSHKQGLPAKIRKVLQRSDYTGSDGSLDREKIRAAVVSGRIWAAKGLGEKSIMTICEWLEKPED